MAKSIPTTVDPEQYEVPVDCAMLKEIDPPPPKPNGCATKELCAKIEKFNAAPGKRKQKMSPSNPNHPVKKKHREYINGKDRFQRKFDRMVREYKAAGGKGKPPESKKYFMHECRWEKWDGKATDRQEMNPDHVKDAGVGGSLKEKNLLWMHAEANQELGRNMSGYDSKEHPGGIKAPAACNCG